MKTLPLIRHCRYFYHRWRLHRAWMRCHAYDPALAEVTGFFDEVHLIQMWRGQV